MASCDYVYSAHIHLLCVVAVLEKDYFGMKDNSFGGYTMENQTFI